MQAPTRESISADVAKLRNRNFKAPGHMLWQRNATLTDYLLFLITDREEIYTNEDLHFLVQEYGLGPNQYMIKVFGGHWDPDEAQRFLDWLFNSPKFYKMIFDIRVLDKIEPAVHGKIIKALKMIKNDIIDVQRSRCVFMFVYKNSEGSIFQALRSNLIQEITRFIDCFPSTHHLFQKPLYRAYTVNSYVKRKSDSDDIPLDDHIPDLEYENPDYQDNSFQDTYQIVQDPTSKARHTLITQKSRLGNY